MMHEIVGNHCDDCNIDWTRGQTAHDVWVEAVRRGEAQDCCETCGSVTATRTTGPNGATLCKDEAACIGRAHE